MNRLLVFFLLIGWNVLGQIPPYYADVDLSLSGFTLQNALSQKIIASHKTYLTYTPGVWKALKQSDVNPDNPAKVLLIYGSNDSDSNFSTDRSRDLNDNGGNVGNWNREHVFPKSYGIPNLGTQGPGSDAHHIRSCDLQRNSRRGNRKFASGQGSSGITSQGNWYPGDEWKGDVARMIMYMYLRYGDRTLPRSVGIGNTLDRDPNMIDLFLQWNAEDPVSELEKQRNPVLEKLQGNRNPFIDNPAFATQIWGGPQAADLFGDPGDGTGTDNTVPSIPLGLQIEQIRPTSTKLSWSPSTDNVRVFGYDIFVNNEFLVTTPNTNYIVSNLTPATTYTFAIRARDTSGNVSELSDSVSATTTSVGFGSLAKELFFSEYIEGSSFNKVLELANYTGKIIDLEDYQIKKQTNGSGPWSTGLQLTGNLANKTVFVIANDKAAPEILQKSDRTTAQTEMFFNGNDAVGLFKNGVLIDLIGTFNSGVNFAKDVTLVRKPEIDSPSKTYIPSEWDRYPKNTLEYLGEHRFNGAVLPPDTEAPTMPLLFKASGITTTTLTLSWEPSTDNRAIAFYELWINEKFLGSTIGTSFLVTNLQAGTEYDFTIKARDTAQNVSTPTKIRVTTLVDLIAYCESRGKNNLYEFIDQVAFGGLVNNTGANGGYQDFSQQIGYLTTTKQTISLSAGFVNNPYTMHWSVWIDYNQNGNFEPTEQVVKAKTKDNKAYTFSFVIPETAKLGNTRLRVAMKWSNTPKACEIFTFGEVEDYTVNISKSNNQNVDVIGAANESNSNSFNLYPNPLQSNEILMASVADGDYSYFVYDRIGKLLKKGFLQQNKIVLDQLQEGLYMVVFQNLQTKELYRKQLLIQ